jgi:cyclopropane fatty-acyl-phospholipid synthase-like methyltransferase
MIADATEDRSEYWNSYYDAPKSARRTPSQFAVFVDGELSGTHRIIDIGCGTGRDSIYFAQVGHDVVGVDASEAAVRGCRSMTDELGLRAKFIESSILSDDLAERLAGNRGPTVVYARFFLHAVTGEEEAAFLHLAAGLTQCGDILAVEYRTVRDRSGAKVTGAHYRRFIRPSEFQANAIECGFDVTYAVEGFGYAKYGSDDAYVARDLLRRR